MDHSGHTTLKPTELTEDLLKGAPIYGPDDEKIGTIAHVHGIGAATEVVVDVGGFLGIGAKPVSLSTDQVRMMRDEAGKVHGATPRTKDELKALPTHHD